ncbi:MAG: UDP-N-acetylglucosamine 1-carboxyvinyltransferase [Microthrixaceae bacterium]
MQELLVRPSGPVEGEIPISGAKNSVLKLMIAPVLAPGRFRLRNVPRINDVEWMAEALRGIGLEVEWTDDHELTIVSEGPITPEASYRVVEQMRASTALLGALLARCGEAHIAMPGGDDFGNRPIDMHLAALERLGAAIELRHGTIVATAPKGLVGTRVVLEYPSVGATENVLLAATTARGVTTIENAAREPEIADLAAFVNRMGAEVLGAGSPTITVTGSDSLRAVTHDAIPDRVEAATFLAALGAAGGELLLRGARAGDLRQLVALLGEAGLRISPDAAGLWAMSAGRPKAVTVATLPYPGIATDYLPMLAAMLSTADGTSFATENLYQGRFRYVGELIRMGANIRIEGHHVAIRGWSACRGRRSGHSTSAPGRRWSSRRWRRTVRPRSTMRTTSTEAMRHLWTSSPPSASTSRSSPDSPTHRTRACDATVYPVQRQAGDPTGSTTNAMLAGGTVTLPVTRRGASGGGEPSAFAWSAAPFRDATFESRLAAVRRETFARPDGVATVWAVAIEVFNTAYATPGRVVAQCAYTVRSGVASRVAAVGWRTFRPIMRCHSTAAQ